MSFLCLQPASLSYFRDGKNNRETMSFASFSASVAQKLGLDKNNVTAVLQLLDEGATIPFIARYRKDKTGGLDEVAIQQIEEDAKFQQTFSERKAFIEKAITEQGKMTEQLAEKLNAASTIAALEDIYLPFKPKRKTRAQTARENGLEPLADMLWEQLDADPVEQASAFLTEQVKSVDEALQGARDIIAERIHEDASVRATMRHYFEQQAKVITKVLPDKENEAAKFKDYFDFSEPVNKIPSHRILAVLRGFMEGFLKMEITPDETLALELLESKVIKASNAASQQVKRACKDAYRRLLQPGLESEFRLALKAAADEEAINVFAQNLRQLLLSAPLGSKRILAVDPGYRTGCKVVCLDETGALLSTGLIYVHEKNNRLTDAEHQVRNWIHQFQIEAVAVGDGTAGREAERFIKELKTGLPVYLVNEDGASVYSASETAREEFPDQDITVRGSVSIGRRLMDPLAELVKIDPKSIGVGQYQHDVNQIRLKERLDQTVTSCVNAVGVNLNTASKHLLSYVSGIGPSIAENIIRYRNEYGKFQSRKELLKVPRLGTRAFEQCAGFLRIKEGKEALDASAVHPEAYHVVERMARDLNVSVASLIGNSALIAQIVPTRYTDEQIGLLTVQDIIAELKKPGLDPRGAAQSFDFAEIFSIEDVREGMIVPGVVTNLTRFGAFVDIGVKQDGLVHVSEMAHHYVSDPSEVLKLNQQVLVKVMEVDIARKRIGLSIRQASEAPHKSKGKPAPKAQSDRNRSEPTMNDALSALRRKFGKS
jgi:uncharacterized protein